MIQANELRIGNWVTVRLIGIETEGTPQQMNANNLVDIAEEKGAFLNKKCYDAIPLAPEILEKAGFTEDRIGRYCLERLTISKDSCWWYSIDCTDYDGDTGTVLTEITHLHQLQNLYFALTGEELTIRL